MHKTDWQHGKIDSICDNMSGFQDPPLLKEISLINIWIIAWTSNYTQVNSGILLLTHALNPIKVEAWMSNYMLQNKMDVITDPCPHFSKSVLVKGDPEDLVVDTLGFCTSCYMQQHAVSPFGSQTKSFSFSDALLLRLFHWICTRLSLVYDIATFVWPTPWLII